MADLSALYYLLGSSAPSEAQQCRWIDAILAVSTREFDPRAEACPQHSYGLIAHFLASSQARLGLRLLKCLFSHAVNGEVEELQTSQGAFLVRPDGLLSRVSSKEPENRDDF